jgi:hypothetical protein
MRAVDVAVTDDFVLSVHADTGVQYGEVPAVPAPMTMPAYWRGNESFLGYVTLCYDQLDRAAGMALTAHLGWRANLSRRYETVTDLKLGRSAVKLAILRSQLRVWGITLAT